MDTGRTKTLLRKAKKRSQPLKQSRTSKVKARQKNLSRYRKIRKMRNLR